MNITGHQHIIGRLASRVAQPFTCMQPPLGRRASRAVVVAAMAGWMAGAVCVAAPHSPEMRRPAAPTMHVGLVAHGLAAPTGVSHDGITESNRKVRESAAHAAAHAKARYPYKPAASSSTAKALGMTDAELTSWLTDIRQQASAPILRPPRSGEAQLHPMRPAHPTDS
ncbi:hypothetical protein [Burkholderia stabilis]|uniref:Uncharacterized protein n=1 Tax=Burkholderia stabilis TaxID=95485 RepID=A0AAJ5T7K9_9BURK|nr:hypothetical protein [Burkholderia stabilis]VBB15619.1 hypothetical protein BSTAB16_5816 [Burkholderia stabilis]